MTTYSDYEFWDFVRLPENVGRSFERIGGDIVEVSPSKEYSTPFAEVFIETLQTYLLQQAIGYVTGGQYTYAITSQDTYMPDAAYVSGLRHYRPSQNVLNTLLPDLVLEVACACDLHKWTWINQKLARYAAVDVPVICICPERQQVEIHKRGKPVQVIDAKGYIDGGELLPGFQLPIAEILAAAS